MARITNDQMDFARRSFEGSLRAAGYEESIIEPLNVQIHTGNSDYDRPYELSLYKGHRLNLGTSKKEAFLQIRAMDWILRKVNA